jgi:hypothetical protein
VSVRPASAALGLALLVAGCRAATALDMSAGVADMAAPIADLARPVDLADLAMPDLAMPDLTMPDLYEPPNPIILWLGFENGNESDIVLVDDPNPPTF